MVEQLVNGIVWDIALGVFVLGVVWRLFSILRIGVRRDLATPRRPGFSGGLATVFRRFLPRKEIFQQIRLHVLAGYLFHVGLFVLLLFAAPHVAFLDERLGLHWTAMPYWAFELSAELAFAGLLLLWLLRVVNPVSRLISSMDDHVAAILTFVVMLTGCMALAESFSGLRTLHFFMVELLMIYFPFSRLMHTFTFVFSRAWTGANFARHGVDA
jgi:nitrate reductase gamma subunit